MKNLIVSSQKEKSRMLGWCWQIRRPLALLAFAPFLFAMAGLPMPAEAKSDKYSAYINTDTNKAVFNPSLDSAKFDNSFVSVGPLIIGQGGGGDMASMLSGGGQKTGQGMSATRMNAMGFDSLTALGDQGIGKVYVESIGSRYGLGGAMSAVNQLAEGAQGSGQLRTGENPGGTLQMAAQAAVSDPNAFNNMLSREGSLTQALDLSRISGVEATAGRQSDSGLVPLSLLGAASAGTANQQSIQSGSGTNAEKAAVNSQPQNRVVDQAQPQAADSNRAAELNTRLVVMGAESQPETAVNAPMQVDTNTYISRIGAGGEKSNEAFLSFGQSAGYLSNALAPETDAQSRTFAVQEAVNQADKGLGQLTQAGFTEDSPEYQSGCALMVLAKAAEYQVPGSDKTSIQSQIESYAAKSGDQKIIAFKTSFLETKAGETEQQASDRRTTLLQQTTGETTGALTFAAASATQPAAQSVVTEGQSAETQIAASDQTSAVVPDSQSTNKPTSGSDPATEKAGVQTAVPIIPSTSLLNQVSRQGVREGYAFVRTGLMTSQSPEKGAQKIDEGIQRAEAAFGDVGPDDGDYQPANQLMGYYYAAGYLTTKDAAKKADYAAKMKDCAGRVNDADLEEIIQSALTLDPNVDDSEKTISLLDKVRTFMLGTDETNAQDRGAYKGDTNQAFQEYEQSTQQATDPAYQNYVAAGIMVPSLDDNTKINATENTLIAPNVVFLGSADIGADVTIGEIAPKDVKSADNLKPGEEEQLQTTIGSGVMIGDGTHIGPGAQIEDNVVLGKNVRIGSNVVVKSGTTVPDGMQILEGTYPPSAADMQQYLVPAEAAAAPQMTQYELAGSSDYVLGQLPAGEAKNSMSDFKSTLDTAQATTQPSLTDVREDFGEMVGKAQSVVDDPTTNANEYSEANNEAVLLICGAMLVDPDPAMQENYKNLLQYFANNAGDQSIQQLGLDVSASGAAIHEEEIRQALGW